MIERITGASALLLVAACSASPAEPTGSSRQLLHAARPIHRITASETTEKALGIAELRVFEGRHDIIITGYGRDKKAVRGLRIRSLKANGKNPAHLELAFLDGTGGKLLVYADGKKLGWYLDGNQWAFTKLALGDIAAAKVTRAKNGAGTVGLGTKSFAFDFGVSPADLGEGGTACENMAGNVANIAGAVTSCAAAARSPEAAACAGVGCAAGALLFAAGCVIGGGLAGAACAIAVDASQPGPMPSCYTAPGHVVAAAQNGAQCVATGPAVGPDGPQPVPGPTPTPSDTPDPSGTPTPTEPPTPAPNGTPVPTSTPGPSNGPQASTLSEADIDRAAEDSGSCPSCMGPEGGDVVADPSNGDVKTGSYDPPAPDPEPPPAPVEEPPPPPPAPEAPAPEPSGE